jgi:glutamate-1-semialdehyde 2,1-aminomutase
VPDSAGIPKACATMLIAPFNDCRLPDSLMAEHGHDIAGIIVEPLQRIIPPEPGFLEACASSATATASC